MLLLVYISKSIIIKKSYLIDPASDPEDGSVKQNAAKVPLVTFGKYFAFCSGVPTKSIP